MIALVRKLELYTSESPETRGRMQNRRRLVAIDLKTRLIVHFALLTAIALWDEAMEKAEANRKKLAEIEAQKELARKEFEIKRGQA